MRRTSRRGRKIKNKEYWSFNRQMTAPKNYVWDGTGWIKNPSIKNKEYWSFNRQMTAPKNYVWDGTGWIKNPTLRRGMKK